MMLRALLCGGLLGCQMNELGKILKEKRETLGLDLDKVHRATKIQEKYLLAIEEGEGDVFSAEIYYKSFVKSYAKFLGFNGEDLLAQYEKRKRDKEAESEDESDNKSSKKAGKNYQKSSKDKSNDLKKLFVTVLIAGVLCAAFVYLNKNISVFTGENPDKVSAIEQKRIQLQKIQEQEQREREERAAHLKEIAENEQKIKEEEENKTLKPFPQKSAGSSNIAVKEESPNVTSSVRKTEKQELAIGAIENVWIKVESDGKEVFQGTMVKGTKKSWISNNEFIVKVGYTPGVEVYFNGAKVDVNAGAVQDVNTLVLKRQEQG